MAVGVIVVGGEARDLHGPEGDEVREQVAERVAGVGDEGKRVTRHAHGKLTRAQEDVDDDAQERHPIGGVVVPEEVIGRQRGAVLQPRHPPALPLGQQGLRLVAHVVEYREYSRSQHEGADVGLGHAAPLQCRGEEGDHGREEYSHRASAGEE